MFFGGTVRFIRRVVSHDCKTQLWTDFLSETSHDAAPLIWELRLPGARPVALPQAENNGAFGSEDRKLPAVICANSRAPCVCGTARRASRCPGTKSPGSENVSARGRNCLTRVFGSVNMSARETSIGEFLTNTPEIFGVDCRALLAGSEGRELGLHNPRGEAVPPPIIRISRCSSRRFSLSPLDSRPSVLGGQELSTVWRTAFAVSAGF